MTKQKKRGKGNHSNILHCFQEESAVQNSKCNTSNSECEFYKMGNCLCRLGENTFFWGHSDTVKPAGLVINQFENVESSMWVRAQYDKWWTLWSRWRICWEDETWCWRERLRCVRYSKLTRCGIINSLWY